MYTALSFFSEQLHWPLLSHLSLVTSLVGHRCRASSSSILGLSPLTTGLIILATILVVAHKTQVAGEPTPGGFAVVIFLVFGSTTLLGVLLGIGIGGIDFMQTHRDIPGPWYIKATLVFPYAYFQAYGLWTFILCCIVAGVISWQIGTRLAPNIARSKEQMTATQ
jgi:hypothetical protein